MLIDEWEKLTYLWLCVTKCSVNRHKEDNHENEGKKKKKEEDDIQTPLEAANDCQHDSVVSLTLT